MASRCAWVQTVKAAPGLSTDPYLGYKCFCCDLVAGSCSNKKKLGEMMAKLLKDELE